MAFSRKKSEKTAQYYSWVWNSNAIKWFNLNNRLILKMNAF